MKKLLFILIAAIGLSSCNKPQTCEVDLTSGISTRSFKMGFSTWPYGPFDDQKEKTYQYLAQNGDIYMELMNINIPWSAWINNTFMPEAFVTETTLKLNNKIEGMPMLLTVSLLNTSRSDLKEDYDGTIPQYTHLYDTTIENAYVKHLSYLIDKFDPDYMVIAMEINELKLSSETKWQEYKQLMANVRQRLKEKYPDLPLSESITLHDLYSPEGVEDVEAYRKDVFDYVNENCDFIAVSFHPFLKDMHGYEQFQEAFDLLNNSTDKPIAIVESSYIAENLTLLTWGVSIKSDPCQQDEFLQTLLLNASDNNYMFVIWWAFRDYDLLWSFCPVGVRAACRIWRDTGLLDGKGKERIAYGTWNKIFKL